MRNRIAAKSAHIGAVGAIALAMLAGTTVARAGDDGSAPLWVGIGSVVGLTHDPNEGAIVDYREHGKLVVPPKMDLPKPGAAASSSPAWPVDQEVERQRKLKEEEHNPFWIPASQHQTGPGNPTAPVIVSATANGGSCLSNGVTVACPDSGKKQDPASTASNGMNPLTWVGIQKKQVVLGPEPDRKFLTDPPKGFREPVEGEGVKVDSN